MDRYDFFEITEPMTPEQLRQKIRQLNIEIDRLKAASADDNTVILKLRAEIADDYRLIQSMNSEIRMLREQRDQLTQELKCSDSKCRKLEQKMWILCNKE